MGTFFSAADEPVSGQLGLAGFETSLVHNFLFGQSLVLHEAFIFNSTLLVQHVGRADSGTSLFEVAAREGVVRPAYRFADVKTTKDALDRMRDVYTRGDLPLVAGPSLSEQHTRIMASTDAGRDKSPPLHATASLGEGYAAEMDRYFFPKNPGPPPGTTPAEWSAIGEWSALISEACAETAARNKEGLQRSELVRSICRVLGVPHAYLPLEELLPLCGYREREEALRSFWLRMNQNHWISNSRALGLTPSVTALQVGAPAGRAAVTAGFVHEVAIPSPDVLTRLPPERLLELRRGPGEHYRQVLAAPYAEERDICSALDEYARRLRRLAEVEATSVLRYAPTVVAATGTAANLGGFAHTVAELLDARAIGGLLDLGLHVTTILGTAVHVASRFKTRPVRHLVEFVPGHPCA